MSLSITTFLDNLEKDTWLDLLESYQTTCKNHLCAFQDSVQHAFEKRLISYKPGSLLDPRLETIGRLFKVYAQSGQENIFNMFLLDKNIESRLPRLFYLNSVTPKVVQELVDFVASKKKEIYTLTTVSPYIKISKKISGLPWNVRVIKLEPEGPPELFVRGSLVGRGSRKEVYELISCTTMKRLAETHIRKKITTDLYESALKFDYKIAKLYSEIGAVKTWQVPYKQSLRNLMEYCNMGNVDQLLYSYQVTEKDRIELALQIAQRVQGMHTRKLCHLGLKLANFLVQLSNNQFTVFSSDFKTVRVSGRVDAAVVSPQLDLWALGVMLYTLKHGKVLDISYQDLKEELSRSCDRIDNCIIQLLSIEPEKRPSAQEVVVQLDLWLQNKRYLYDES